MYGLGPVLQSDTGGAGFLIIILVFLIIIFGAVGYATYWIYKDAQKRDNEPALWVALMLAAFFIVGIFGPPLVLLAWVLVRDDVDQTQNGGVSQSNQSAAGDSKGEAMSQSSSSEDDERDPWEWDEEEDR